MFRRYPMRELLPTRQVKGEPPRRWFASSQSDLIVWLRADGALQGFQFCYDKDGDEHALTWMEGRGYSHMRVDLGTSYGSLGAGTPLLVPDGVLDPLRILELFQADAGLVPPEYTGVVESRLEELVEKLRT